MPQRHAPANLQSLSCFHTPRARSLSVTMSASGLGDFTPNVMMNMAQAQRIEEFVDKVVLVPNCRAVSRNSSVQRTSIWRRSSHRWIGINSGADSRIQRHPIARLHAQGVEVRRLGPDDGRATTTDAATTAAAITGINCVCGISGSELGKWTNTTTSRL